MAFSFYKVAVPKSLEEFFQKSALLGQKAALNLWYVDIKAKFAKTVPEHLKVSHIWRIQFLKNFLFK